MKKFFYVLILLCIINVSAFAENMKTELPIDAKGIKERNYIGVALTDAYNVNVFTEESNKLKLEYELYEKENKGKLCNGLKFNGVSAEFSNKQEVLQYKELGLFTDPCNYTDFENNTSEKTKSHTILIIIIFTLLAVLSFLMALVIQRKKRR